MTETGTAQTSEGHTLVYDETGSGPPVILVCGILQNRGRWHEAGYVDRLSSVFRVITMDPLGHGESDKPYDLGSYKRTRLVEHIEAVADAASADDAVLWGYSRGGAMVAEAAWSDSARWRGAIIGGFPLGVAFTASTPEAVAALDDGDWDRYWSLFPLPIPAVSYYGDGEVFDAAAREAAATFDLDVTVLPTGGHAETFWATDACVDVASAFLESLG